MDVQAAVAWKREHRAPQVLAVGDDHESVGVQAGQPLDRFLRIEGVRLPHRQTERLGRALHCRRPGSTAAARRSIGLGDDRNDIEALVISERAQAGNGEIG
jgi:hypothetical protein